MNTSKILHVIAGMDPASGGVCKAVRTIISGLSNFKMYNEVVSLDAPDADYFKNDIFPIHAVGEGKGAWKYNSNLLKWLNENLINFDIVIVHGLWLYPGFAVRKVMVSLKEKGKKLPKLFVMPHGMLDPYFQVASGRKIKAFRNWVFWKFIEKHLIAEADGILFTCEMEKTLARNTFSHYYPKKELVVGLGIKNPPLFTLNMQDDFFSKTKLAQGEGYFLYLGRIDVKKGIDLLIKAYLNLEKLNTIMPALVVAGPGLETKFGQQMKQMASISSRIHFTGMLTGDAKWGAYYGCDAFVLPSHQENFGIAVVEAMACGKAVLISNQINIWKEIEKFGASVVCKDTKDDTEKMLDYWIKLSSEKKHAMSLSAKYCFNQSFETDTVTKQLSDAICI